MNPRQTLLHKVDLRIPKAYGGLFIPSRFKVYYGGRGSAKSWSIARALIALAYTRRVRVLCVREYQSSINDSVMRLLADQVRELGLSEWFDVGKTVLTCTLTGSEFLFKGIRVNIQEIKSTEGVDLCWVEEAQAMTAESWQILIPTIRKQGSEIWVSFNPDEEIDPTYQMFVVGKRPDALVCKTSWNDNPAFPATLDAERRHMLRTDPDAYSWIWDGNVRALSEATIFRHSFEIRPFETPEEVRPFLGADWGFAADPTTLVRSFIQDETLFIDFEAYGVGVEIDDTPALFDRVPGARDWPIKADGARPETISYIRRQGFQIAPAEKWKGCVEDGIAHIKAFKKVVIHERCEHVGQEFRLYSYRRDPKTRQVLPVILDKHNHCVAEGQLVATARGDVPIQDVRVGDLALTRSGYRRVYSAERTSEDRGLWELCAGGRTLLATGDHKVWTRRGWTRIDALRYTDDVFISVIEQCAARPFSIKEESGTATLMLLGSLIAFTSAAATAMARRRYSCIGRFGKTATARFRPVMKSTTKTATQQTTTLPTLRASRMPTTWRCTPGALSVLRACVSILRAFDRLPWRGIRASRAMKSIGALARLLGLASCPSQSLVDNAAAYSLHASSATSTSFAPTLARPRIGATAGSTTKTAFAPNVDAHSDATDTPASWLVAARVVSVRDAGRRGAVYDLSVADEPEFIASGILVENCIDAIRYSLDGYIQARDAGSIWARLAN